MSSQPSTVAAWYNQNVALEDSRLTLGRLEFAVTSHYIQEAIVEVQKQSEGSTVVRIADIGCGTGVYAIPLAKAGHEISICDISSAEVELAKQKAHEAGVYFNTAVAFDARRLVHYPEVFKEDHYDVLLLLGPLYHIMDERERADVLLCTLKTLRPGGFLLAAFVTKNAHLRDIATRDPERLHREFGFYSQYLIDGRYTRGSNAPMHHTTPEEIRRLLDAVNHSDVSIAELVKMVSCEGFLGFQGSSYLAKLDDDSFQNWLDIILASAEDEPTHAAADHILVVLRRV